VGRPAAYLTLQHVLCCRMSYLTACLILPPHTACLVLQHVFHSACLVLQNVLPYSLSCPASFYTKQHGLSCSLSFIQPFDLQNVLPYILSCPASVFNVQHVLSCSMSFIQPVLSCRMSNLTACLVLPPSLSYSMSCLAACLSYSLSCPAECLILQPVLSCRMSNLTACLVLPPSLPYIACLVLHHALPFSFVLTFLVFCPSVVVLLYSLPASLAYCQALRSSSLPSLVLSATKPCLFCSSYVSAELVLCSLHLHLPPDLFFLSKDPQSQSFYTCHVAHAASQVFRSFPPNHVVFLSCLSTTQISSTCLLD
jgi:hypothetical protein